MIKLNKYQAAEVIKKFRPEITPHTIKSQVNALVIVYPAHNELYYWQASVDAVLNGDPLPWEL